MGPITDLIQKHGLIAVVTAPQEEYLVDWGSAVAKGGIKLLGVPVTFSHVAEVASDLADEADLIVGVSGVIVPEHIMIAVAAGAHFIISPICSPEIIQAARERSLSVIAGAATPTEIYHGAVHGPDLVNIYPATPMGGPAYFAEMVRQFPQVPMVASGGVDIETAPAYLEAGAVAAIVDTGVFPKDEDPSAIDVITMRALALTEVCGEVLGGENRQSMSDVLAARSSGT